MNTGFRRTRHIIMTDKDIRREWESHFDDILPKADLDRAFTKVMVTAEDIEKAHDKKTAQDTQNSIDLRRCGSDAGGRPVGHAEDSRASLRENSTDACRSAADVRDIHP